MTQVDSSRFVSRSALKILSGTLLSRITGMLRDISMAYVFGASASLAAFLLAYRLIYLIRRLLGEGLLHQGFIPHFEALKHVDGPRAARFFRDLMGSLFLTALGLVLVGEIALFQLSGEVVDAMRWMLPGTVLLCLFGLTSGLLNAQKSFFIPSVAPALFNLIWIFGTLAMAKRPESEAIFGLCLTITLALAFQLGITLPKVWQFLTEHLSCKELLAIRPFSKCLKGLSTPLLLGVIGVAAVQVNSAIDGIFARFSAPEGPAYLWYAIRMQQLPLALFGLALSSALLPSLSRAFERGDSVGYLDLLHFSIRRIYYLLIPCTLGIFVLGVSSVNLLLGRGDFGPTAITQTVLCLWGYGIGLIPMALTQILAPAFYAKRDYKTPAMGFVYCALLNISLNTCSVFVIGIGPASIAFSTSLSAFFNVFYLKNRLNLRTPLPVKYAVAVLISALVTAAIGAGSLGDGTLFVLGKSPGYVHSLLEQLLHFGAQATIFFGLTGALVRWGCKEEWAAVKRALLSR